MYQRYERLYRRILHPDNLTLAYRAVTRHPAACSQLPTAHSLHKELCESIKDGSWQPAPLHRGPPPLIPDRLVQQAILQVLLPIFERDLSPFALGLRPERGRGLESVLARRFREEGRAVILRPFIDKFADNVDHQILLRQLRKRIKDEKLLNIIGRILANTLITEDGQSRLLNSGIRQSGNLLCLLGTLYLSCIDRDLEKQGRRFIRFSDEYRLYLHTRAEAEETLEALAAGLETKLRLRLDRGRSVVEG